MTKIKLQFSLQNNTTQENYSYQGLGIIKNDTIIFQENDLKVTIFKEKNTVKMRRKHKEYEMLIPLEEKKQKDGYYHILGLTRLILQTQTTNLQIEENQIHSEYDVFLNQEHVGNFILDLNLEVIQ